MSGGKKDRGKTPVVRVPVARCHAVRCPAFVNVTYYVKHYFIGDCYIMRQKWSFFYINSVTRASARVKTSCLRRGYTDQPVSALLFLAAQS